MRPGPVVQSFSRSGSDSGESVQDLTYSWDLARTKVGLPVRKELLHAASRRRDPEHINDVILDLLHATTPVAEVLSRRPVGRRVNHRIHAHITADGNIQQPLSRLWASMSCGVDYPRCPPVPRVLHRLKASSELTCDSG